MNQSVSGSDPASHYDRVIAAWDVILGDDLHHGLFDPAGIDLAAATENLTRVMAEAAEIGSGDRIADLGCGTGTQACWMAARYPGATVVGLTSSAVGADRARRRVAACGLNGTVDIRCADAMASGLDDGSVDVVWLLESSQYLVPRSRQMGECARLLAPQGRMVICDPMLNRSLELSDLRRLHGDLEILRETFGDAVMGTNQEYCDAAAAAGFTVTKVLDLTDQVRPTFDHWVQRARRAAPRVSELIGAAGLETFTAGCEVMARLFSDDIAGYALIVAAKAD